MEKVVLTARLVVSLHIAGQLLPPLEIAGRALRVFAAGRQCRRRWYGQRAPGLDPVGLGLDLVGEGLGLSEGHLRE